MKKTLLVIVVLSASVMGQSLNKKHFAAQVITGGAKEMGEYNFVEHSVKSNSGKELYKIIDKVDYDIPYSKLEVFDDGSSVLISSFYGTLTFISNDGAKVKSLEITNNIKAEYERSIKSVSDKNELIVLLNNPNEKHSLIQKYDNNGNILNEFTVNITDVNGIAYSKRLNQIYVSMITWKDSGELEKKVVAINNNGEIVKSFNTNFEKGFFTADDQFVGVSNKSVFSIIPSQLKLNFEIKADKNSIFIDVTAKNNSVVIAKAKNPKLKNGEWYYKNPIILKLNFAGKVISEVKTETELFSKYKFEKTNNNLEFMAGDKSTTVK